MRALLPLALLAPSAAWVTKSQSMYGAQVSEMKAQMRGDPVNRDPQAQFGWLWTLPSDPMSTRGLGGGITYAWDPALCTQLLPRFQEDIFGFSTFLNCETIKASVARAFDKWAANNRFLKFLDVSAECTAAGWPNNWNHPTIAADATSRTTQGCPLAEIWITRYVASSGRRMQELAAEGPTDEEGRQIYITAPESHHDSHGRHLQAGVAVATAQPHGMYTESFRYTNGARPFNNANHPSYNTTVSNRLVVGGGMYRRRVVEVFAGTFRFNADSICWYMDSTFCAPFHSLKTAMKGANNARLLVFGITYGFMAVGILFFLCFIGRVCVRASGVAHHVGDDEAHHDDEDGDGVLSCGERLNAGVRAVSHFNPMVLTIFIACCLVPPLVTDRIFKPCFDCYDFEAAALHEIGHFLGFGHPDNIPNNWEYPRNNWAGPTAGQNVYQAQIATAVYGGTRPPASACLNPMEQVFAGVPPETPASELQTPGTYQIRNCQMEARTQHNPLSCLLPDDIEGLKVLYPDCGPYSLSVSVCHNVQSNIGLVRVAVYVLLPSIVALLGVVCFSTIVHSFERREKERLMAKHADHVADSKKKDIANKLRLAAAKTKAKEAAAKRKSSKPGIAAAAVSVTVDP